MARLIAAVWQDARYAIRGFRRAPGFFFTVVATVALGLGFVTALFTVLNAFYLRPLPVRDPHSLYEMFWMDRSGNGHDFTWQEYREVLAENPAFSEALAFRRAEARIEGRRVSGILVSADYFQMLGVNAALGRTLLPEDGTAPGGQPVVVLAYSIWQSQFAGDRDIVGRKILLRGYPFQVVGVAPPGFIGLGARPTDFWAPVTMSATFDIGPDLFGPQRPRVLGIVGRLKPGFTLSQARDQVTRWAGGFVGVPSAERVMTADFVSRATSKPFNPKNALMFSLVMVAFTVVLLIGCTNVANLMLARAVGRQREIGIRLSLGASRGRLIRQLLTESMLMALPAGALGLAVSRWIIELCIRVMFATIPAGISFNLAKVPDLPLDLRVFGFGLAAAALSALFFGLAPALQATRTNVMQAAQGEFSSEFRPSRLRNSLIVGQITVCVVLLVTAALLLRAVGQIQTLDKSLSTRDNIEIMIEEPFRARVLDRLSSHPVVELLAAASSAPVDRKPVLAVTSASGSGTVQIATNKVSPEYFDLFEIPILRGRNFTAEEARSGALVTIVSQAAADQLWPRQEAIGQAMRLGPEQRSMTVIGIARDEISRWITDGNDKALVYSPAGAQAAGAKLFVRAHGEVEAAKRQLDVDLNAVDPNAVAEMQKLQIQEFVVEEAYSFRILYWMSSAIGFSALLLTLSGIYGVLSYVVSQRTKEIGIRMALGATPRAVSELVLRECMSLAIAGTALGCVLAAGMSRILASTLVMMSTFDWVAYLGGTLLVLAACAAAAYLPSRRAAHIDPTTTLRYD